MPEKILLCLNDVGFYTYKPLKDKGIRVSLDTQELPSKVVGKLDDMYKLGEVDMIISTDKEFMLQLSKIAEIGIENPELLAKIIDSI